MNALRLSAVAATLSVAVLGALMSPAANAQSPAPAQRIEVTGQAEPLVWVRDGDDYVAYKPFVGLRTRAEVVAEMMASRAAGEYFYSGDEWVRRDSFASTKTRADVLAEAAASRARGDFVRVGDELLPRHVAEQVGGIARSTSPTAQSIAGMSVTHVR
jgi:hypothetical protein